MDTVEAVIAMIGNLEETPDNYQAVRALKRISTNLRAIVQNVEATA
jgi:hypothetical protein